MIEWTINLGGILSAGITLLGWIGGAVVFYTALRTSLAIHAERLLMLSGRMINVENELKELKNIVVIQASQSTEISALKHQQEMIFEATRRRIETIESRLNFCEGRLKTNDRV